MKVVKTIFNFAFRRCSDRSDVPRSAVCLNLREEKVVARPKSEDKSKRYWKLPRGFRPVRHSRLDVGHRPQRRCGRGTLFRYFATKDELLNELYLAIKLRTVRTMIAGLDPDEKRPKENARNIWNSYIDWGVRNPMEHKAIRRMALSERITDETRRR